MTVLFASDGGGGGRDWRLRRRGLRLAPFPPSALNPVTLAKPCDKTRLPHKLHSPRIRLLPPLLLRPTFARPIFLPHTRGAAPRPCTTVTLTHFSASQHLRAKPDRARARSLPPLRGGSRRLRRRGLRPAPFPPPVLNPVTPAKPCDKTRLQHKPHSPRIRLLSFLLLRPTFTRPIFLPHNRGATPRPCATVPLTRLSASQHLRAKPDRARARSLPPLRGGSRRLRRRGLRPAPFPPSALNPVTLAKPCDKTRLQHKPHSPRMRLLSFLLLRPTFARPIFFPHTRGATPRPCATVPLTHFSASQHPRAKPDRARARGRFLRFAEEAGAFGAGGFAPHPPRPLHSRECTNRPHYSY